MKKILLYLTVIFSSCAGNQILLPTPSETPSKGQQMQIDRQYGMFIHFGMNTFHNEEWTDGTKPPHTYAPTKIDALQWIRTAKQAGMKYVILVSKHDGFCLWDSKYTTYDVAASGNPTNVIEEVAKACKKEGIGLGLYYSLWDRNKNPDVKDLRMDSTYNEYMIRQIDELLNITRKYVHLVEFWFDGGWSKANTRWPIDKIYQTIKKKEPLCQIGINWSIGLPQNPDFHAVHPHEQKEGYPIRYFPSDFRLGDPDLPRKDDPKIFTHDGKKYYMPWESTICLGNCWFYNTNDTVFKSVDEIKKLYDRATANDNILIINCSPNREGVIPQRFIQALNDLREKNHPSNAH